MSKSRRLLFPEIKDIAEFVELVRHPSGWVLNTSVKLEVGETVAISVPVPGGENHVEVLVEVMSSRPSGPTSRVRVRADKSAVLTLQFIELMSRRGAAKAAKAARAASAT
jgi:hypothetical protein